MKIPVSSLTLILFISSFSITEAAILTVDNNAGNQPDFTSFQAAHEAAEPGDTIFIAASAQSYEIGKIQKPLTIIGSGFGNGVSSTILNPRIASNDLIFMGLTFVGTLSLEGEVTGLTFFRNHFPRGEAIQIGTSTSTLVIASNISFINNLIEGNYANFGDLPASRNRINNLYLLNNIFTGNTISVHWTNNLVCINNYFGNSTRPPSVDSHSTGIFRNNIFNNAIVSTSFADETSWQWENNITLVGFANHFESNGYYLNHTGHVEVSSMSEVITINLENMDIGRPIENSPAIGSGTNGTDIGPYGGLHPWNDTRRPALPYISRLEAPALIGVGETLEVTLEAKPNN